MHAAEPQGTLQCALLKAINEQYRHASAFQHAGELESKGQLALQEVAMCGW